MKENLWYHFNEKKGGKWEETEMGHKLRSQLSNKIVDLYMYWQSKYQQQANMEDEESEMHSILNNRVSNCSKVIIKLKDSGYKDKIMKECREYFYDKTFLEKLNEKKNLIGFENGIYDIEKGEFRDGSPDDYVSMTTKINYVKINNNNPKHLETIKNINEFMEKLFPDEKLRQYMWEHAASSVVGRILHRNSTFTLLMVVTVSQCLLNS